MKKIQILAVAVALASAFVACKGGSSDAPKDSTAATVDTTAQVAVDSTASVDSTSTAPADSTKK